MKQAFAKMHGLGNDFVVIDATERPFALDTARIRALADRQTGVGFDQLLVVEPPSREGVDFDYRIFNADGGEVEHCGNGARCFAVFVRRRGLSDKSVIPVGTANGPISLAVRDDGQVTVDMGEPNFEPAALPFARSGRENDYALEVDGRSLRIGAVSVGNPHAVWQVEDVATAPVGELGPLIESHGDFPRRVNAGFLQVIDRGRGALRVFERGVGETRACGTGACAAMVVGRQWGLFDERVTLTLTGGDLELHWSGPGASVQMTGPAAHVYDGSFDA